MPLSPRKTNMSNIPQGPRTKIPKPGRSQVPRPAESHIPGQLFEFSGSILMINRTSASVLHYEWYLRCKFRAFIRFIIIHPLVANCAWGISNSPIFFGPWPASRAACYQFRFKACLCSPPVRVFGMASLILLSGVHLRATFDIVVISLWSMWPIQRQLCFTRTCVLLLC